MLSSFLLLIGFLTIHIAFAADILTFKITDFQGRVLDLTYGSPNSLTPVLSVKNTSDASQKWKFIFAMSGDTSEYRVTNVASPFSILSYTTADLTTPGGAIHTQIVGKQNVSTFWDVVSKPNGWNFIEKKTQLAMTAWPISYGSSPLTLEKYDEHNARQVFNLTKATA